MAELVSMGESPVFKGFIWFLGETEPVSVVDQYQSRLQSMIDSMEINFRAPEHIFVLQTIYDPAPSGTAHSDDVNAQQRAFADANDNAYFVETSDLSRADAAHWSSASMLTIGERVGSQYLLVTPEPNALTMFLVALTLCNLKRRTR